MTPLFLFARMSIKCSNTTGRRHDPDVPGNHDLTLFHQLPGKPIPAVVQHCAKRPVSAP
jgi:hypothetical protein